MIFAPLKAVGALVVISFLAACSAIAPKPGFSVTPWGVAPTGEKVELYTLRNRSGMEVRVATYGATLVSILAPDRDGKFADVILGFDSLTGYTDPLYLKENPYFGAAIGRYGNRIAKGRFSLNGVEYSLAVNNGVNHLHGGDRGFDKVVWTAKVDELKDQSISLRYVSKDGEEGYPGALDVSVTYTLTDKNELVINYAAKADKDTILNLTNHAYFNLNGEGAGDILGHQLQINADNFTPVDDTLIPTGEVRSVKGTPFDFAKLKSIAADIKAPDEQLAFGNGYDHNFVLNRADGSLARAARLVEPESGRSLEIWTTEPGLQFYSGNFLKGNLIGKGGRPYVFRGGLCLETQHFPDSPNKPQFPSTVLFAGKTYQSSTMLRFGTDG